MSLAATASADVRCAPNTNQRIVGRDGARWPNADIDPLFDQLVGTDDQRQWDGHTKRPSGPHVDEEFKLCRLLHR
jgi:hypothetical protein